MTGYVGPIGGEEFPEELFAAKGYLTQIPRLMEAVKRHVAQAWSGTSTTSNTVGSGVDKTFVIQTAYGSPPSFEGQPRLKIFQTGSAANGMYGNVKSYNPLTGEAVVAVDRHTGSGTFTDWSISISGADGAASGASNLLTFLTIGDESAGAANSRRLGGRYGNRLVDLGAANFAYIEAELKPATVSTTTYTHLVSDRQALLRFTNAAGCAVTGLRPHDSSGAPNNAPSGFCTWIDAVGGPVTVTPSTGTVSHNGVTGAASFLFPKGSFGFIESAGGDVWIAHITRHGGQILAQTGATLTVDRSHNRALIGLDRAAGVAVTLPATDGLGIGEDFQVTFQAVLGTHVINRAGSNVFDKSGGATSITLLEGESVTLRSNGLSGASGIWGAQRSDTQSVATVGPGGRLSAHATDAVSTGDVAGAATVYYLPHVHAKVPVWTGAAWKLVDIGAGLSQALSDTTKSPAAAAASKNYDLFVWDDAGTIRCTRGPLWDSDTARGTGAGKTELELWQGRWVNKVAITNGPAARLGTYVGSVRTNGSTQVPFVFQPGPGAGGVAGAIGVWNLYNQVDLEVAVQDSNDSWTYSSTTYRQADNSAGMQVEMIRGLALGAVRAIYTCLANSGASAGATISIGLDAVNARAAGATEAVAAVNTTGSITAPAALMPGIGWRKVAAIEKASAAASVNFYGDNNATCQGGLTVGLRC